MLGKENRQTSFFDTDLVCTHLIDQKSFYAKMHDLADRIVTDDEFADIYCPHNGRPSVPPARLTKVLILQHYENLSDRKALENVRFNIKWKYALDVPLDYEGFDRSLLVYFRSRLLISRKERMIFQKTLELAREAGLLKGKVDQVIDSTPMLGAGAVKDTYELIRDGITRILPLTDRKTTSTMSLSLKVYGRNDPRPKINWDERKEREELLFHLVSDAKKVLSHLDTAKDNLNADVEDAARLLAKIISQDTEEDTEDRPRIKKGVAKDRIISTTDPEMRHGRKSKSGRFNGYKTHLTKDVSSDIVTNIEVSKANSSDHEMVEPLLDEVKEECGLATRSLTGDTAYGSSGVQERMRKKKIELISKVPSAKNSQSISKEEFRVDLEKERVICPEGKMTTTCYKRKNSKKESTRIFLFPRKVCEFCIRRSECTTAKSSGRTITIGPDEEYLQKARERQRTEEFKKIYHSRRPAIERKIAELIYHGLRKTRYVGTRKSRLQALFTAAVVNLKRVFKAQENERILSHLPETIAALSA